MINPIIHDNTKKLFTDKTFPTPGGPQYYYHVLILWKWLQLAAEYWSCSQLVLTSPLIKMDSYYLR